MSCQPAGNPAAPMPYNIPDVCLPLPFSHWCTGLLLPVLPRGTSRGCVMNISSSGRQESVQRMRAGRQPGDWMQMS